jgi:hypothetical protein
VFLALQGNLTYSPIPNLRADIRLLTFKPVRPGRGWLILSGLNVFRRNYLQPLDGRRPAHAYNEPTPDSLDSRFERFTNPSMARFALGGERRASRATTANSPVLTMAIGRWSSGKGGRCGRSAQGHCGARPRGRLIDLAISPTYFFAILGCSPASSTDRANNSRSRIPFDFRRPPIWR